MAESKDIYIYKESSEKKSTSIVSEFKQFFGQDSIFEEYEVLLSDKDLWTLMQIPFSPELAEEITELAKPAVIEKKVSVGSKDELIIRESIARELDKAPSQLTEADYENVISLSLSGSSVKDIKPLVKLTNLQTLDLEGTAVSDLDALYGLTNLQILFLEGTAVSNLDALSSLTNLQKLDIVDTKISDLEPIKNLTNLTELWLENTHISSLEPIKGLKKLQKLDCEDTLISDLEPIKGLTNLERLWLGNCKKITDKQIEELKKALPDLDIVR